jgi:hypothetical protein
MMLPCYHFLLSFVRNKLIYEYQSGFLPNHSTIHQLLELYNSILNSLEKKKKNCFLFGPKIDHWGTPAETSQTVDDVALLSLFAFFDTNNFQTI